MIHMTILSENKTYREGIGAEHGLALYLETDEGTILYDAGSSDLFIRNAKKMKVDLQKVDFVVISHGHYDHTGGVPAFTKENWKAPIYVHEDAFRTFYGTEDGKLDEEPCGIRWRPEEQRAISTRIFKTSGITWLTPNLVISGTIPKHEGFVETETFYYLDDNGAMQKDEMTHEQFLAIYDQTSKGVHVFSGCSHSGILSAILYAKTLFPGKQILTVTGGFHLYHTTAAERKPLINLLAGEPLKYLVPLHCTGMGAISDLMVALGDRCLPLGVGDAVQLA